jgi:organic radical activating enzyme
MNVFKIHKGIRKVGLSYGLPVIYIDIGPGANYKLEELIAKLSKDGLSKGTWIVIRGNPLSEKGIGTLVSALKYIGMRVEVEDEGMYGTPGWFPQVDRWTIYYKKGINFNLGALRARQDIILYKGEDIVGFIEDVKNCQAEKGIVANGEVDLDLLIRSNTRVYGKEEGQG